MIVVLQRVKKASVQIEEKEFSYINKGLLVFVGIEETDSDEDINWLAVKISNLRIFDDEKKVPNLSIKDINAEILVVSQFTLHAQTKKGNRPSYIKAARPQTAIPLYEKLISALNSEIKSICKTGQFGADMQVSLINDGPLTIIIDSKNKI